jgi:hypothetical protein
MSNLTRYENRARNTHDIDPDHDGKIDGFNTGDRPVYAVNCNTRSGIWVWFKSGFKLLWFYPFSFSLFCIVVWFIFRPLVFVTPVAAFRNNPKILTEKEAGGEFNALINNTVVGVRGFAGASLEAVQERQIKANTENAERRPDLVTKAKVVFVDN